MDEIIEDEPNEQEESTDAPDDDAAVNEEIIKKAKERFKQAYEYHKDNFESCGKAQDFIAGDQWPQQIKNERLNNDRPCLTLDHLNQYVRHVVNVGLMQSRDVRVLAMSGEADDKVGEILAGMVRQITQTSTAKVAYETGLRHACQVGFGYWRVKVQNIPKTDLMEITVRKIKEPRMVLMDPFCEYPDGRDSVYAFVMVKLTRTEFEEQYPEAAQQGAKSWHDMDSTKIMPWIGEGSMVVAEYYYLDKSDNTMKWAILCPDMVLSKGIHHGDVMPIVRVIGEEYEQEGKERWRGMISESAMDAQRAYNYSSSAFIEAVALAPLAPFIAAEGQVEDFQTEWKDAHRVPRSVLRYTPVTVGGVVVPPPTRSEPAGIPNGWQGMMTNLIGDTQMIIGMGQPSVMGTGGAPVQSGAGINAQQEPGEVNTFHFQDHWHMAIEQTGRVILAMIPHVYTEPQAVKIVGEDGIPNTAIVNPNQQQTIVEDKDSMNKVLSTSYNPNIGRYDVAISTGPSSASKKLEANKLLMTVVNADPSIMQKAGDLVVASMDMAGADVLAKRLKALLPPGTTEEPSGQMIIIQQLQEQLSQLQQDNQEMEKILLAEREKYQAKMAETELKAQSDLSMAKLENSADLFQQKLNDDNTMRLASIKAQNDLEISTQNNIVKVMIAKIQAKNKLDVELIKQFNQASTEPTHEDRMAGYMSVMEGLGKEEEHEFEETAPTPQPQPVPSPAPQKKGWKILKDAEGNMTHIVPLGGEGDIWEINRDEVGNMAGLTPKTTSQESYNG